jgi:hydroxyacylglutathione hydrolase
LTVEPNNQDIKHKLELAELQRSSLIFTIPSTIGDEKTFNPFMRVELVFYFFLFFYI